MKHSEQHVSPAFAPKASTARHRDWLAVSAAALLLSFCLEVLPDQQHVAVRGFTQYPLPHVCSARVWLGVKCPACGLTRSVIHLSHGDWRASLRAHRFGWIVAALIAAQVPYRLFVLSRPTRGPCFRANTGWSIAIVVGALLIASWLFDLAFRPESLMTGEPTRFQLR